ncbi:sulfurtransferase [Vibrio aphrogenes]|uniref:sulfurtransferase n=1 Tax=Vibrio aphrogenes TaxID=1891186 RepID=UPI000B34C8D3|nr:sulfurtransferase [Vibrio aphrogenes]
MKTSYRHIATVMFSMAAIFPAGATTFEQLADKPASETQVIDCRSSNIYNGWDLPAYHIRGGHFPNASNIEPSWLTSLSSTQQEALFHLNHLDKNKPTYVYCDQEAQHTTVSLLKQAGFQQVHGIAQSIHYYDGKRDSLANYQDLVPVWWVKKLIDGEQVMHPPQANYKIVEVAWGPAVKYLVSHIPGALYLNTNDIESEPLWNKVSDSQLAKTIATLGIDKDSSVILYGRDQSAAARAASILMYAGVKDVRLINGGWQAWQQADYPTEALKNSAQPVKFGAQIPLHPELYIDVPQAKKLLADQLGSSLVSIRSWPEYLGETSGYSYIKPKGRISGSKWGHAGSDAYHMEDFNNPDNTMISEKVITQFWKEWGIQSDQNVSFYCGTGWRASEAFFYAHVMGWQQISVFDGGWYEWSAEPNNPVETGEVQAPIQK